MKNASWFLFYLSVVLFFVASIAWFVPMIPIPGVLPGTAWKAAMSTLAYSAALKILTLEPR
jgi:hypothetical protein